MTTMLMTLVAIALFIYGPLWAIKGVGYLIQKFQFGNSFKEVYNYHKEQDRRAKEK